ncbi:MAG: polysaccharide biosynthesis C-terminal domain-containing protein [Terracidiphilus sp.]
MSAAQAESIVPALHEEALPQHGFRAVTQSITSKAVILTLQAGTGILTARELLPWGRGELAAMILWPLLVASVTTLGVPSSLIYFLRHRPEERDRLVYNGFLMAALLGLVAACIATAILPLALHQYSPSIVRAAEWFLITVPICSLTLAGRAVLEASHDFSASNAIQTLTPFATLVGLLVFLALRQFNPYTAGIAYIAASLPAFWLMAYRVRRFCSKPARVQSAVMKLILGYGIRSYGIDVLGTLALYVDQVLVIGLLSPGAMGSYVVVLSLSRMLNLFQNSVVMVLFPKAAGRPAQEVVEMTGDSVRISGLVTALCGIMVCLAGPTLLRILYGSEYVAAAGALRILVVEVVLSGATFVLAQAFMALDRPGVVTLLQALGLSLSIPLMLVLIPRFGIYGAAISLLTSTVARLLFVYCAFRFFLKTKPPRLVPAADDIRLLWSSLMSWRLERAL